MKKEKDKYRHEFKYPISEPELRLIEERIKGILTKDPHVGASGKYIISSLYFDDCFDSCFYENENGTDPREKFRIRIYNHDSGRISLECKRKEKGKTLKNSCFLTKEQTEKIINDESLVISEDSPEVLKKFVNLQLSRGLKPRVIVEYERIPYIYKLGNVRVTFDTHLSSSEDVKKFLIGGYVKRPVMPLGTELLEVKYDEFLPTYIYRALQIHGLTQTAFSKYYLCRKYGLRNL
ncbi:MAG: polyphosphate polymerase domain-containing protein [Lachnospiraceae bacterium]|nr:polyphosphate polymerase domain-containing protein [Lachnospiraceae bacterium]